VALISSQLAQQNKSKEQPHLTTNPNRSNPLGMMLAKAEVIVAAAVIAYVVTIVTVRMIDRWRHYRRSSIGEEPRHLKRSHSGLHGRSESRIVPPQGG
jgi:hypothetical protein